MGEGFKGAMHCRVYSDPDFGRCLAIRGMSNSVEVLSDIAMLPSAGLKTALFHNHTRFAKCWAEEYNVDYITGHSLGGFIAEVVAAHTGKGGASFLSPGPRGTLEMKVREELWNSNTSSEVHLHAGCPVSSFRSAKQNHIATPTWY